MKIKVSELIVKYMEHLGIDHIFGMPGAHILPVYDSLFDSSIKSILAKHEQGAAFMAGGYTRASGKISACITTAGPGATNLVTGIANAYADKQPILIITGETPTYIFGKGGLQESSGEGGTIDQHALFRSITQYNKIVERTDYLAQVLNQISKILLSSNPGPVLLSFPFNVQNELVDDSILDEIKIQKCDHDIFENASAINRFTKLLSQSNHPVIIAGYGCIQSNSQLALEKFSSSLNIPVATSIKGRGSICEQSDLSLGSLGVTSNGQAYSYITEKADLLVILGAGFNERTSYLWDDNLLFNKRIIQVDNNREQLDKVFNADIAIHGDILEVLNALLISFKNKYPNNNRNTKTLLEVDRLKQTSVSDYKIFKSGFSLVEYFFSILEEKFKSDAVLFDDNIVFAQNFLRTSTKNHYYPNSGISSLGHAIPAAIGAQFFMENPTFAILGDGGFQMCCMEIMTAVNYHKSLNIVIFNNSTMGLIRKNQHQQYDKRFINSDFINPDYRYLALSFGINHIKIVCNEDIDRLFSEFDLFGSINLIEIIIHKDSFPDYSSKR